MLNLPTPKLGDVVAFTIATTDLEASLAFYLKLGFRELYRDQWPFPWIQITDGAVLMMLRKDSDPYIAQTYYVKEIDGVVGELESLGISFTSRPPKGAMIQRYVMQSPDRLNVSLVSMVDGFTQPPGPTMLKADPATFFNPETYVNKVCGLFGEFAHPVEDIDASMLFWEKLGFAVISRFTSPYPWAIISDGLAIVGLHQTNDFDYPAITFFASDMKKKVEELKAAGLPGFDDSSATSNVRVTTPEGQHVFLFKLGM